VARRVPCLTARLQGFGETIFAEMSALALRTGAINLGQGFPDEDGPVEVSRAAIAAIEAGHNQYPPGIGIPELRHAVSVHQRRFWGLDFDPDREVLVTAGATEAIAAALLALCDVGDEVVAFEPTYDSYAAGAAMSGATLRVVTLRPPDYDFDLDELRAAVTPRTRLLLLNSPHNPTGKVFSRDELDAIARVCLANDLVAVTDEVYEHLVFDGEHVPLAALPGMRERTLTVSSGGKTFSFTGWKVGWVCGPDGLVEAVRTAKQFLTYANAAPFQHAIALGLGLPDTYFARIAETLRSKRDRLCAGLADVGFDVYPPAGTYFVTADIRPFGETDGVTFCRELPERTGVVAVPNSVFYTNREAGRSLVRFAFCKRESVLDEAVTRLKALRA
jgi:N-succinyldiaminopimelate aminotransferase